MAIEIKPLNAIVYNRSKVDIKDVIAPPYDVIGEKYRDELYERSPYNITRLILSKAQNPYSDAAEHFKKWQDEKILIKTDKPVIFLFNSKVQHKRKRSYQKGFYCKKQNRGLFDKEYSSS